MAKDYPYKLRYISDNIGNNEIGDMGCGHLIKGDWKHLICLILCSNWIKKHTIKYMILAVQV